MSKKKKIKALKKRLRKLREYCEYLDGRLIQVERITHPIEN